MRVELSDSGHIRLTFGDIQVDLTDEDVTRLLSFHREILLGRILAAFDGGRVVTMEDLGKDLGVSRTTVWRGIVELRRRGEIILGERGVGSMRRVRKS